MEEGFPAYSDSLNKNKPSRVKPLRFGGLVQQHTHDMTPFLQNSILSTHFGNVLYLMLIYGSDRKL